MKKILLSILTIGVVGAVSYLGLTGAFYSDTETSTGNVLEAGALDLKIDNECYYNGKACILPTDSNTYYWGGIVKDGNECYCTWELKNLTNNDLFFRLRDLKPGDWEEDTLSLHVYNNDAWLCADLALTADDDVSSTEPELEDGDVNEDPANKFDGELAKALNFMFWRDDGDNVLETDEYYQSVLTSGAASDVLRGVRLALADKDENYLGGRPGDPMIGSKTYYIGKAMCFGEFKPNPVPQSTDNSPVKYPGFDCDGSKLNNITQTDMVTGDISFYAEQWRNNPNFQCQKVLITL